MQMEIQVSGSQTRGYYDLGQPRTRACQLYQSGSTSHPKGASLPLLRSWTFGGCHWVSPSASFGCSVLNHVSQIWLRPLTITFHAFQMFSANSCIPIVTWTSFVTSTSLDPQSCSYLLAMTRSYFTFHLLIQLAWHSASLGFDPSIGLWPLETSTTVKLSYMPTPKTLTPSLESWCPSMLLWFRFHLQQSTYTDSIYRLIATTVSFWNVSMLQFPRLLFKHNQSSSRWGKPMTGQYAIADHIHSTCSINTH